jgi:hypothetical protein
MNRIAFRAFERASVETPRSRFDAGKPHRLAAFRTGQDSDFSATDAEGGAVMEPAWNLNPRRRWSILLSFGNF